MIAGLVASRLYSGSGQGLVLNIVLGIVGAFVGGFLFDVVGGVGVTGFNVYSLIVAIFGSIVVLWLYHKLADRRVS